MTKKNVKKVVAKARVRKSHDYVAIRKAYALLPDSVSLKSFALKMGVPLRTLQQRIKRDKDKGDPWEHDLAPAVKSATKKMQQRIAAGLGADTPITDEAVAIQIAAATNVAVLATHEEMFSSAAELVRDSLKLAKGQLSQGFLIVEKRTKDGYKLEEADVSVDYLAKSLNGLTSSMERVVKMQRHHLGMDDKEDAGASYEDDLKALHDEMGLSESEQE